MGMFDPNITYTVNGTEIDPATQALPASFRADPSDRYNRARQRYSTQNVYVAPGQSVNQWDWMQNYVNENNIAWNPAGHLMGSPSVQKADPGTQQALAAWREFSASIPREQQREYERAEMDAFRAQQAAQRQAELDAMTPQQRAMYDLRKAAEREQRRALFNKRYGLDNTTYGRNVPMQPQATPVSPVSQPNTMFGQTPASTSVTQNNLLNALTNKIKSQRAAVLKNLFGM